MATIDMGRKEGDRAPFTGGALGPRLTKCGLGRGLLPYQVASSSIQPFGYKAVGQILGGGCALFLWAENWGLCAFSEVGAGFNIGGALCGNSVIPFLVPHRKECSLLDCRALTLLI